MLLVFMLLIHLVLQLWLISVYLMVCTLAYALEHSIIHDPAARRRVPHCVPPRRAYSRSRGAHMRQAQRARRRAQGRDTTRAWRAARNEILEHASPVLGSGLGKIGLAGDPGIVTPRRGRGCSGARGADFVWGRGALILSGGAGRGALVSGAGPCPFPAPALTTESAAAAAATVALSHPPPLLLL